MKSNELLLLESAGSVAAWKLRGYERVHIWGGNFSGAQKLPADFMSLTESLLSDHRAGQVVDWVYAQYVKPGEDKVLNELFEDERGCLFIKKNILCELARIFYSFLLAEKFRSEYAPERTFDFIPSPFPYSLYKLLSSRKELLPQNVIIPQWYLIKMRRMEEAKNWLYSVALIAYPVLISLRMSWKETVQKEFEYAVHMWESWVRSYGLKCQYRMDFLESPRGVHAGNTLYFIDQKMSAESLRGVRSSGYPYCYFKDVIRGFDRKDYWNGIYPRVRKAVKELNAKGLLAEIYLKAMRSYIHWEMFLLRYKAKTFIYAQDPCDIPAALMQKRHGARNVFVYYSTQYDSLAREKMDAFTQIYYGYMIYSAVATSRMSNNYFRKNRNLIERYEDCGIIWSDIVYQTRTDPTLKNKIKQELGLPLDKTIIGFFAPGMGHGGFISEAEGHQMISDVYDFLESREDCCMVLKYRQIEQLTMDSDLRKKFDQLRAHKRVHDANALVPACQAYHLMGVCDLVIGGFHSSVPMESVAGGVRTLCYVPERLNKEIFVINTFPHFCAHNYTELVKNVGYWLNQCTEKEFRDFQDTYVKAHIDGYCDGQAQKRLRALIEAMNAGEKETGNPAKPVLLGAREA